MAIRASTIVTAFAFGGFRGRSPTLVAMRTKQQVAKCCPPLGERVERNEVRTRGTPPPPFVINKIDPIFVKIRHPLRFSNVFIILENKIFD